MYGKIFRQIYNSSIANNWKTRVVFMDLIVMADSDGIVDMTVESIAATTRYPIEMVKDAIAELEAPDPQSRTCLQEGKRLIRVNSSRSWGWQIVNYNVYREMRSEVDRKSYIRNYMRDYRKRTKKPSVNTVNNSGLHVNTSPSPCTYRSSSSEGGAGGNGAMTEFEAFWKAYPKKTSMFDAQHAFVEVNAKNIIKDILAAIEKQKHWESWTCEGGKYIPSPSNWLRDGRWNDKAPECGYQKSIL